mmetsp:Transcript_18518/g.30304  ORF Transcript_18518/g.30304 Transcript_18518/m.30304 type:complete len:231 (+) Transcript_18518:2251-2943(+)
MVSMPATRAASATAPARSPDRISTARPALFNAAIAATAPARKLSVKRIAKGAPVPRSSQVIRPPPSCSGPAQPARPMRTVWPCHKACVPNPGTSVIAVRAARSPACFAMALDKGCVEASASAKATACASEGRSSQFTTSGAPSVRVPVLSKTTVSTAAKRSSAVAFLIKTPLRNSAPEAAVVTAGTARPKAQGQVMIRTAAAMFNATRISPAQINQPTKASAARIWTPGA